MFFGSVAILDDPAPLFSLEPSIPCGADYQNNRVADERSESGGHQTKGYKPKADYNKPSQSVH
jgi:hypothetical protein